MSGDYSASIDIEFDSSREYPYNLHVSATKSPWPITHASFRLPLRLDEANSCYDVQPHSVHFKVEHLPAPSQVTVYETWTGKSSYLEVIGSCSHPAVSCQGDPSAGDTDGDGFCDDDDNCPTASNPTQLDSDGDGQGDACDPCPNDPDNDADGDGVCGDIDNCPAVSNANQADSDGDGVGDVCDNCPLISNADQYDSDGDGIGDKCDNCPTVENSDQADSDGDGQGDACDICPNDPLNDVDGDGFCGDVDNCPTIANPDQADSDEDGFGDDCDPCPNDPDNDADDDGVCGDIDLCPGTVADEDIPLPNHYAMLVKPYFTVGQSGSEKKMFRSRVHSLTLTAVDTGGCSCHQILEELGKQDDGEGCPPGIIQKWLKNYAS